MKSGLDMVQDAFKLINTSDFTSLITGKVYLYKRPQNSRVQDLVINSLALTTAQLQVGVFNVNIHAPNLEAQFDGNPDNTMPDLTTLQGIANLVSDKLGDYVGYDYRMWITQPAMPFEDNDGTWYLNIKVNYQFFQSNYTNI